MSNNVTVFILLFDFKLPVGESNAHNARSSTLKSTLTDYDTPPETPELRSDRLLLITVTAKG